MGQQEASRIAEERDRPREREFICRVRAHENVVEDWMEHHDDRHDEVRPEAWLDPLAEPSNPTEAEERFVKTRKICRRVLEWRGDLP